MNGPVASYGEVAAGLAVQVRRSGQQATGLPPLLVAARRGLLGWRVWITATEQGPHSLTPDAARKLAVELIEYAHLCETSGHAADADVVELIA